MREKRISILNDALAKYLIANEKLKPLFLRIFSELSSFSYEELKNAHMQLGELPKKNKNQKKQVLDALFRVGKGKYLIA